MLLQQEVQMPGIIPAVRTTFPIIPRAGEEAAWVAAADQLLLSVVSAASLQGFL